MKTLAIIAVLTLSLNAFANHHEEKKKEGNDKEHSHVSSDKIDRDHGDTPQKNHDHKAHHPEHKEEVKKKK